MENIVKLSNLHEKQTVIVYKVVGLNERLNRRLIQLGFIKNEKIEVIKNLRKSRNMLISIRGYTLSLDYMIAERVMVWQK